MRESFKKCPYEPTLFLKHSSTGKILIVCLYVDDLIFTGNDESLFISFKHSMMQEFEMSDLGKMMYFLRLEILQGNNGIFLCQQKYAPDVLERFQTADCNSVHNPIIPETKLMKDPMGEPLVDTLYKQLVSSLKYLTSTRPNLMFGVNLLSRYMAHPSPLHLQDAKRVLRYVKGTLTFSVFYFKEKNHQPLGFSNSDYAGDVEDCKSTYGFVFLFSSRVVSWSSHKQPIVTLSTIEAKFVATASYVLGNYPIPYLPNL